MAIDPHIQIEDLKLRWTLGTCILCRETCDPEGYMHSQCAVARYDYMTAQKKEFWANWKIEQDKKVKKHE